MLFPICFGVFMGFLCFCFCPFYYTNQDRFEPVVYLSARISRIHSVLKDLCRPSHAQGALLPPGSHTLPVGPAILGPHSPLEWGQAGGCLCHGHPGLQRTAAAESLRMTAVLSIDSQARGGMCAALPEGHGLWATGRAQGTQPAQHTVSFPATSGIIS